MPKKIVNSFNAGELSPYLYAREDVDKYQAGCQELENFVPLPYGGVSRRPSIEYISNTKDNKEIRLFPFTFNVEESFMLEIGNTGTDSTTGYFRFYKNGQPISIAGNGGIFEVGHNYLSSEINDLKFTQSADVLFIVHPNHPVSTLTRTSAQNDTSWQFSEYDFNTGYPPLKEQNADPNITITSTNSNGITTLTSSQALFNANHVGAYFSFLALRKTTEQSISETYGSSTISRSVNVSGSNWTFETNGTWLGRVVLQRSTDGGSTFTDYIVVGDTSGNGTSATANNTKNFLTSSEDPEENNVRIRVRYDHTASASNADFNFSFVIESPYVRSLVKISSYISATQVQAEIISDFQDAIGDYATWVANNDYQKTSTVVKEAEFTASNFDYTSGNPIDLTQTTNVALGTGLVASDLDDMNNVVGSASGVISQELYTISAASYSHSTNRVTITTSTNHNVAVGMTVTIQDLIFTDPPLSNPLADPNGTVVVTERTSATQFKYQPANSGSHTGSYNLSTNPRVELNNVRYFFSLATYGAGFVFYKWFSSPVDNTITCIQKQLVPADPAIYTVYDIAFYNDSLYLLHNTSANNMLVNKYSAINYSYQANVLNLGRTAGGGNLAQWQYTPRSIGFGGSTNRFFIAYAGIERRTTSTGMSTNTQNYFINKLSVVTTSFNSVSVTTFGDSQTEPLFSDLVAIGNTLYALDSTANIVEERSIYTPHSVLASSDISNQTTRATGIAVHYDDDNDLQIYISEAKNTSNINGGKLYKYKVTPENVYYECVKNVDSSTNNSFASQLSAGNWVKRFPNMSLWTEGAFSNSNGFPSCVALFQNRLCFSGVSGDINTIWLSNTDDYNNFTLGSLATSAMSLTINSGNLDSIRWLVPHESLIIGTSGSEWVLESESDNVPVSSTAFSLNRRTTYGSNNTQATLINSAVIFAMRQGRKVREWTYDFNTDDFVAPDLTIFSEHITEGGIENWAYQQQPDNLLWLVRADGQLLGFTYEREQKVYGWHRHIFDNGTGKFESVSVLPSIQDEDKVYVQVKTTINPSDWVANGTAYVVGNYVEYNDNYYVCIQDHTSGSTTPDADTTNWDLSSKDVRFVGLLRNREFGTYDRNYVGSDVATVFEFPTSNILTGLDYLEGKSVAVVADGIPIENKTVTLGKIDVGSTDYAHIVVGLPYTATLAPMYLDVETTGGTTMGSKKDVQKATVRFKDTLSAKVGQTKTDTDSVRFANADYNNDRYDNQVNSDSSRNFDTTVTLFNEDVEVWMENASEFLKLVYVINDTPTPCTVLAMIIDTDGEM